MQLMHQPFGPSGEFYVFWQFKRLNTVATTNRRITFTCGSFVSLASSRAEVRVSGSFTGYGLVAVASVAALPDFYGGRHAFMSQPRICAFWHDKIADEEKFGPDFVGFTDASEVAVDRPQVAVARFAFAGQGVIKLERPVTPTDRPNWYELAVSAPQ